MTPEQLLGDVTQSLVDSAVAFIPKADAERMARRALAVVLEAAARVAENEGRGEISFEIATAIRALLPKE